MVALIWAVIAIGNICMAINDINKHEVSFMTIFCFFAGIFAFCCFVNEVAED